MHREIAPGVVWIQECGPDRRDIAASLIARGQAWYERGRPLHVPQNAYLFRGDRSLLFDPLSPSAGEQIITDLDDALDGDTLDFLVVSHPDVPHAGNTHRILERYPSCTLVAPAVGDIHELYHLEDSLKVSPGDEIDLGGPVDWLGFPHMDGECLRFTDELAAEIGVDRLTEFHSRVMFWFQYVDVPKVQAEIDRLARDFQPRILAPSHGLVVRTDPERYFGMMKEVVRRVAETGRGGVL